ncbi:hypothetical protein J2R98_001734 [Alkalibacillus filiformis]|uniref:Transposase n=1 Tax=Alkalibacillus filiformis TaxID=200990 RepID=A0ABU0DTW2_9BACI|nr:hypothetical protein [Alkalibacillus filiformis]
MTNDKSKKIYELRVQKNNEELLISTKQALNLLVKLR